MPAGKKRLRSSKRARQQYDISHHDNTAGSGDPAETPGAFGQPGAIDGIGGTGGSSGVAGTRADTTDIGTISGIDVPLPNKPDAVSGTVPNYKHSLSDSGLPGKTRRPASETIPNADSEIPDERQNTREEKQRARGSGE